MFFDPEDIFVKNTLSVRATPGEDKLYQNTNTESIFTFGDFRIERYIGGFDDSSIPTLNFDRAQNLTSLTSSDFSAGKAIALTENDLNLDLKDPNSYSYFGSYYTKLANTINKIIDKFPYAILGYDGGIGQTNFVISTSTSGNLDFTDITLISSAFTNQGNILFTSGNSINSLSASTLTLFDNYDKFEIQLSATTSGQTLNTSPSYPILQYGYSAYSNYYHLNFRISGVFSAATTDAIYIRPSKKRYFEYKRSLGNLEYQLLEVGKFSVPNPLNDQFFDKLIQWPRTIDGFAPDSYGANFDNYLDEILKYATLTDQLKTNWMIRTLVPENFLELDTDGQIYSKMIQTYGEEFDKIKEFIDNLAYSHSVNYTESETVSNKFLGRLTELLGWNQPINFTDVDFFEFLGQEDDNNKTLEDYNFDLWRRILTNINWLYKKKGTRDAIMFIFDLIGAPECLVNFNEFVYKINRNSSVSLATTTLNVGNNSFTVPAANGVFATPAQNGLLTVPTPVGKVNQYGYVNFQESNYQFQEGGSGRGNGQNYMEQWQPEFNPIKTVDNIKVQEGTSEFYGTQNILNSKEIQIGLDPASAIECDVFDWYKVGFFYTGNTSANLPSDYKLTNEDLIAPPEITGFTVSQWLNFVYNNSIDVRNRKTETRPHHNFFYPNLRKIYLTYYYWNVSGEISNQITFRKLEQFLRLIESKIFVYLQQIIPATTIFEGVATIYRNTVFNRQKFVYPKGINDGSEFKIKVPAQFYNQINGAVVTSKVNNIFNSNINSVVISSKLQDSLNLNVNPVTTLIEVDEPIPMVVNAATVTSNILSANTFQTQSVGFFGTPIPFPLSGIPIGTPPPIPQPYTGNTGSGGGVGPVPINPQQSQN